MLFDFNAFIQELRENTEKKEIIEKYEKLIWPISGGIKDQIRFTEYLVNFNATKFLVPDELEKDFDVFVKKKNTKKEEEEEDKTIDSVEKFEI